MAADITVVQKRPWKRILYEKQPYKDNYVDPVKFLDQLNMEKTPAAQITLHSLFVNASVIAQQFTVVSLFLTVYKYLLVDASNLYRVGALDVSLLLLGCGVQFLLDEGNLMVSRSIQTTLLFGIYLRVAAPVLRTLTLSISGDTVHAMGITMATMHLVFHDYAYINSQTEVFSGTISVNAAMFTAIILASRLDNIELVVAFLLLAVICFALYPSVARLIKNKSLHLYILLTILQWLATSVALYFLDSALFVAYEAGMVCLWLVGPYVYFHMQVYKKSMHGPWDIAEV
jgi:phosphatidylinositol glycan class C protein